MLGAIWDSGEVQGQVTSEPASPREVEAALAHTREDRRQVQRALAASGYDVGPLDGIFGQRTWRAINAWQIATERESTGYLDRPAYVALAGVVPSVEDEPPTERLRSVQYEVRLTRIESLEGSHREPALLAFVLEQVALGELALAAETAHRIVDPKKRARALERLAEARSSIPSASEPPASRVPSAGLYLHLPR